jgi:hypothetical protein
MYALYACICMNMYVCMYVFVVCMYMYVYACIYLFLASICHFIRVFLGAVLFFSHVTSFGVARASVHKRTLTYIYMYIYIHIHAYIVA